MGHRDLQPSGADHRIGGSAGPAPEPAIVDASHVRHAKPEPDLLLAGASQLGVAPIDVWYVGDARWDMLAAVAAGMVPVAVLTGATGRDEMREAGARIVVATLAELIVRVRDARSSH